MGRARREPPSDFSEGQPGRAAQLRGRLVVVRLPRDGGGHGGHERPDVCSSSSSVSPRSVAIGCCPRKVRAGSAGRAQRLGAACQGQLVNCRAAVPLRKRASGTLNLVPWRSFSAGPRRRAYWAVTFRAARMVNRPGLTQRCSASWRPSERLPGWRPAALVWTRVRAAPPSLSRVANDAHEGASCVTSLGRSHDSAAASASIWCC